MNYVMDPYQYTVRKEVKCHGVGLHSGKDVELRIKPAEDGTGIRFFRSDLPGREPIYAHMNRVVDTTLATTLGNDDFRISTIEHLMAALRASGIDNADIEVSTAEVPIMDGSAAPFVTLLQSAGMKRQHRRRRVLKITRPVTYTDGDKKISIRPYNGFKVSGSIAFDAAIISHQEYSFDFDSGEFAADVARARTFGLVEEVEQLWAKGLARGGNLSNVIAVHWDGQSILNEDGLRYRDEFVRHKVLDLIGDIALLGIPVLGHITARKVGHTQHLGLMKAIEKAADAWEVVELESNGGHSVLSRMASGTKAIGTTFLPFFHADKKPSAVAA